MRRLFCLIVALVGVLPRAYGNSQDDYKAFNTRIHAELAATNPEAEALLSRADAAREAKDPRTAVDLYGKVAAMVPTFDHAVRRQAMAELELGDRDKALALASRAVQTARSADNLASLAVVLATPPAGAIASADDRERARTLAAEAARLEPRNAFVAGMRAQVSASTGDLAGLDAAVEALEASAPAETPTVFFAVISKAAHGDFDGAEAMLERAHGAGMPDEAYRSARQSVAAMRPLGPRILRWGGITAGAWVAGGLLLLVIGLTLSAVTLRQSERVPEDPNAGPTRSESRLRGFYRFVLGVCCVYYYVSLPILFALVLAVGGGLLYEMLSVGHFPIKLIVVVFIATIVTVWSIVKSIFVRVRTVDPGERLDLEGEPRLRDVLTTVAERVGTRPVDTVFLTPGTEVAVFERGGLMRQLAGKSERCLILGAGVLDGMRLGAFQAVLAHEYGHFSNRDTAGGGFALSVRRSVVALATNLARNGAARWYNPAWLFVNAFHRVFLRISQGASRLQEVLADRWAAILFGAQAFEDGLRHVIDRSVRFDLHANATVNEVIQANRPLANLYRYAPRPDGDAKAIERQIQTVLEREPSPYDSHPRPLDRFRWVHALRTTSLATARDAEPVWSLFRDRDAIEERMTSVIRNNVHARHGIKIAAS